MNIIFSNAGCILRLRALTFLLIDIFVFIISIILQLKPLNGITLEQIQTDSNKQMIFNKN